MRNSWCVKQFLHAFLLLLSIKCVQSTQQVLPVRTAEGLRALQPELDVISTARPRIPSELLKRLTGDPGICGWVDGDGSKFLRSMAMPISAIVGSDAVKIIRSRVTRATAALPLRPTSAAVRQVPPRARTCSQLATILWARSAMLLAVRIQEP